MPAKATKIDAGSRILRYVRSARSLVPQSEVAAVCRGPGYVGLWRSCLRVGAACGFRPDKPGEELISTQGLVPGDCEDLNGVQLGSVAEMSWVQFRTVVLDKGTAGHLVLLTDVGCYDTLYPGQSSGEVLVSI